MNAEVSRPRTVAELAAQKGLPPGLVAAFGRLSQTLGNPLEVSTSRDTIEEALIDEAIRRLSGTGMPSRRPTSCACGRWSFCAGHVLACGERFEADRRTKRENAR